jgi:hypothetical protein
MCPAGRWKMNFHSGSKMVPWFQRFIFIIFIAKGRRKINLWNQGSKMD